MLGWFVSLEFRKFHSSVTYFTGSWYVPIGIAVRDKKWYVLLRNSIPHWRVICFSYQWVYSTGSYYASYRLDIPRWGWGAPPEIGVFQRGFHRFHRGFYRHNGELVLSNLGSCGMPDLAMLHYILGLQSRVICFTGVWKVLVNEWKMSFT